MLVLYRGVLLNILILQREIFFKDDAAIYI